MVDGIQYTVSSITTRGEQTLYLSKHDVELIKGKRVAIVDDVISTGGSLSGLEKLVEMSGGKTVIKATVLAEGNASNRSDIFSRHYTAVRLKFYRYIGVCTNIESEKIPNTSIGVFNSLGYILTQFSNRYGNRSVSAHKLEIDGGLSAEKLYVYL